MEISINGVSIPTDGSPIVIKVKSAPGGETLPNVEFVGDPQGGTTYIYYDRFHTSGPVSTHFLGANTNQEKSLEQTDRLPGSHSGPDFMLGPNH